jgi:hypothetical protein
MDAEEVRRIVCILHPYERCVVIAIGGPPPFGMTSTPLLLYFCSHQISSRMPSQKLIPLVAVP